MRFFLLAVCLAIPAFAQQCSFSLSPPAASFTATGGTGIISITATESSCSRPATSSVDWISIPVGPVGTGNGTVGYTVQPNATALQRTGTINVAGQIFTVSQAGANCAFGLTPSSASIYEASMGLFGVLSNVDPNNLAAPAIRGGETIGSPGPANSSITLTTNLDPPPGASSGTFRARRAILKLQCSELAL